MNDLSGKSDFSDASEEVEVIEISFGSPRKCIERSKFRGRGFFADLIDFFKFKPKPPSVVKKLPQKPGISLFFKEILDSLAKKPADVSKKPLNVLEKAGKEKNLGIEKLKQSVEKENRSKAAVKAWKERKEKAERLLAQLDHLEQKERERQLSEADLLDKSNLYSKLSEIKSELSKVSANFETEGVFQPKGIQIILGEISKHESIDEQIAFYKMMQKQLEFEFYKRRISDSDFKKNFLEYQQKIMELEFKKKNQLKEAGTAAEQKSEFAVKNSFGKNISIAGFPQKPESNIGTVSVPETGINPGAVKAFVGKTFEKAVGGGSVENPETAKGFGKEPVESTMRVVEKPGFAVSAAQQTGVESLKESSAVAGEKAGGGSLLNKMDKLVDLMEEERRLKAGRESVGIPKPVEDVSFAITGAKKEKIEGIEKDVKLNKIVTDFDRVLDFIKSNGKVSVSAISKQFSLSNEAVMEIVETLESNRLVKTEYSLMGTVNVSDINFVAVAKKKKSA